jgi:hypothetical protein
MVHGIHNISIAGLPLCMRFFPQDANKKVEYIQIIASVGYQIHRYLFGPMIPQKHKHYEI